MQGNLIRNKKNIQPLLILRGIFGTITTARYAEIILFGSSIFGKKSSLIMALSVLMILVVILMNVIFVIIGLTVHKNNKREVSKKHVLILNTAAIMLELLYMFIIESDSLSTILRIPENYLIWFLSIAIYVVCAKKDKVSAPNAAAGTIGNIEAEPQLSPEEIIEKAQKKMMITRIILTSIAVLGAIFAIWLLSTMGGSLANHRVNQWAGVGVILIVFFAMAIAADTLPLPIASIVISTKQTQGALTIFLTFLNIITIASTILVIFSFFISWRTGNWSAWFVNF